MGHDVGSCCCALNECFDFSSVVTTPATCSDGCRLADVATGTETDARNDCLNRGAGYAADAVRGLSSLPCTYIGYVAPSPAACACVGGACANNPCVGVDASARDAQAECANVNPVGSCVFNQRVREVQRKCEATNIIECYDFRGSNSTCREQATCSYMPAEYGATASLDADMTTANAFCT